jgi:hypothetical protein
MEGFMSVKILSAALLICVVSMSVSSTKINDGDPALLQSSIDVSAAAKRKPRQSAPPGTPNYPIRRAGPADPSFGPDGRPYQVPEYLRNQCYIDEGYGRFSACNNRN